MIIKKVYTLNIELMKERKEDNTMANPRDINNYKMAVLGLLEEMNSTLNQVPKNVNERLAELSRYSQQLESLKAMKVDTIKAKGEDIHDEKIQEKKIQVLTQLQGIVSQAYEQNQELKNSLKNV